MQRVRVRLRAHRQEYEIIAGRGTLQSLGEAAVGALSSHARRALIISNPTIFKLYGRLASESLKSAGLSVSHWLMPEGERHKSFRTLESALSFFAESRLERTDAVVALGGGVVGDLAGFAAAIYLRGLAFIQAPTTLLAQIDSSVGGKVAVNYAEAKNTVGAFHQPRLVVIDTETLRTLPRREVTAGLCECVKQGAVGDVKLFRRTRKFLEDEWKGAVLEPSNGLEKLIAAQVAFKASIVAGDEREDASRTDSRSRRILNFGHTTAHALEAVTNYRRFRHGEAVGYGMLVAGEISKGLGMLSRSELESLRAAVGLCGRLPRASDIDMTKLTRLLARDKKSVGGRVQWVLLERLGRARLVDEKEIAPQLIRASLLSVLQQDS
ncbi:MAG TPA: 3-dehydroquinate synthase [Pyrinomonadaceae bacterium]|nr:3-dehydroquinate synthase [Pyrinomonadaceae bacterium]